VADRLVAWLYDTPVAVLIRGPEFRIRLEWRPEGIERWGLGSPALSVGLPIGTPAGAGPAQPGLLREHTAPSSAVVTETLDQVLAAIPATPSDARILTVIRKQAERTRRD
jgi:hypothetical protein